MKNTVHNFSMESEARNYVESRFPHASLKEKNKIISDWANKEKSSRGIVADIEFRTTSGVKGIKILDAGSGNGGLSIALSEAGANVTGVDVEKELVEISRRNASSRNLSPEFVLYDGNILPFVENSFDMAISVSVLEHVDNPVNFLKEIYRVLKPGEIFYLAFPNRLWPKETHTGLWGITYIPVKFSDFVVKIFRKNPLKDNNLHFYTYWDLRKMIQSSGLGKNLWKLREERGKSENPLKVVVKKILNACGIPYKAFLPHISVILEKINENS